jgi:hypothetical protein
MVDFKATGRLGATISDIFPVANPASVAATAVVISAGGLGDVGTDGILTWPPETEDSIFAIFTVLSAVISDLSIMCVESSSTSSAVVIDTASGRDGGARGFLTWSNEALHFIHTVRTVTSCLADLPVIHHPHSMTASTVVGNTLGTLLVTL